MFRLHDLQELGNAGDDAVMVARGPFDAVEEQIIEICVGSSSAETTTRRRPR